MTWVWLPTYFYVHSHAYTACNKQTFACLWLFWWLNFLCCLIHWAFLKQTSQTILWTADLLWYAKMPPTHWSVSPTKHTMRPRKAKWCFSHHWLGEWGEWVRENTHPAGHSWLVISSHSSVSHGTSPEMEGDKQSERVSEWVREWERKKLGLMGSVVDTNTVLCNWVGPNLCRGSCSWCSSLL